MIDLWLGSFFIALITLVAFLIGHLRASSHLTAPFVAGCAITFFIILAVYPSSIVLASEAILALVSAYLIGVYVRVREQRRGPPIFIPA